MEFFPIIGQLLDAEDNRAPYFSWTAKPRPSEGSAELRDQRKNRIVGRCQREVYFRLTGAPSPRRNGIKDSLTFLLGKLLEEAIIRYAKRAGIFVASGVRVYVPDIDQTLVIDVIVLDPATKRLWILENKSTGSYQTIKQVFQEGQPKAEAVLQLCDYLNEFPTRAELAEAILTSYRTRQELETRKAELTVTANQEGWEYQQVLADLEKYQTEVDFGKLAEAKDGPVSGKLTYEDRTNCRVREFTVSLFEDEDGLHYPVIDGAVQRDWTLESLYARFETQKEYHEQAKSEAQTQLARRGIVEPGQGAAWLDVEAYRQQVAEIVQRLGPEFWPPAEYEWRYAPAKIERLFAEGLLSKDAYKKYKVRATGKTHKWPGDTACAYCKWAHLCLPVEYPEFRYLWADAQAFATPDDEEEEEDAAA